MTETIKRTTVTPEEVTEQRIREGFQSVCCYGTMRPEENEIGGIFKNAHNARTDGGVIVYDAECIERIFVSALK